MYRLLAVDVDGTLMGRDRAISPRVRAAIRDARAGGTLVTLATGRWFRSAQPIAADLAIDLPIILHNGALVKDSLTGEVLDHCHLPRDLAEQAIGMVVRHGLQPIVYENAFEGERVVAGPPEHDSAASARYLATKEHLRRVPIDELLLSADPLGLVITDTADRAEPLLRELAQGPWRTVTSMSTLVPDSRFVEVMSPECSKTRAIRALAARWGIAMGEVMAVGDNFNDLDMIETAGFGIAMGNAPAEVRARAQWVAPTVEQDGLAIAIERFVLSGEPRPVTGPGRRGAAAGW